VRGATLAAAVAVALTIEFGTLKGFRTSRDELRRAKPAFARRERSWIGVLSRR
jgi:hypothetical protein